MQVYASYAGLVPPPLIPLARNLLAPYGVQEAISSSGDVDASVLLALAYDTLEIRSNFTDPITINLADPSSGAGAAYMQDLQPAVILRGRAGTLTLAPAGLPTGGKRVSQAKGLLAMGVVGALAGLLALGATILRR